MACLEKILSNLCDQDISCLFYSQLNWGLEMPQFWLSELSFLLTKPKKRFLRKKNLKDPCASTLPSLWRIPRSWIKKIPKRKGESSFPSRVCGEGGADSGELSALQNILGDRNKEHKKLSPFVGPAHCFSPHILINISGTITIWLSPSLWCWVSWVTTFSTGCRSNDCIHAWQKLIHLSKGKWAVSRKEWAPQHSESVGIENTVTQITEGSCRQTDLFCKKWLQMVLCTYEISRPGYRVFFKADASKETLK